MKGKMSKKISLLVIFFIFPLMLGLACNMPTRNTGLSTGAEVEDLKAALAGEVVDDRAEVYENLGRPDAFDISIVEVEGVPVRMESWRYYQYGSQVDFVDGSALWIVELDPVPEGTVFAAWYDPRDFVDGISGTAAIQLATQSSPSKLVPQRISLAEGGEDLAGGLALVGDQIVIGLYENQVVYVETIALMPEGGQQ